MSEATHDSPVPAASVAANSGEAHASGGFWGLTLGSVGVVYGDIGTSPLYAFREALTAAVGSGPISRDTVLGVLSMMAASAGRCAGPKKPNIAYPNAATRTE